MRIGTSKIPLGNEDFQVMKTSLCQAIGVQDSSKMKTRAHPDLNQGPADLQSAALTTELCTRCRMHSHVKLLLAGLIQFTWDKMTLAGLEPAIFGSEDQRLIH